MGNPVKLTFQFAQGDLDRICALEEKIIAVVSFSATGNYLVIGAAFSPFGLVNTLQFLPQWTVYASEQSIIAGSNAIMAVSAAAIPGHTYPLINDGLGIASSAYSSTVFGLDNQTMQSIAFGVAQAICINGHTAVSSPLAICTAPANATTYLEPLPEVNIFLATNLAANQIQPATILRPPTALAEVAGKLPFTVGSYLAVDLTADSTIYFDSANNCFTLNPPPAS